MNGSGIQLTKGVQNYINIQLVSIRTLYRDFCHRWIYFKVENMVICTHISVLVLLTHQYNRFIVTCSKVSTRLDQDDFFFGGGDLFLFSCHIELKGYLIFL